MFQTWGPFFYMNPFHSQMNACFDDFCGGTKKDFFPSNMWYPPVDIIEKEKEVIFKVELPGMEQKDIELSIEGKQLTIKGEKKLQEDLVNYIRRESFTGNFHRTFMIDTPFSEDSIIANYKNGILEVVLSKIEHVQTKKISIN